MVMSIKASHKGPFLKQIYPEENDVKLYFIILLVILCYACNSESDRSKSVTNKTVSNSLKNTSDNSSVHTFAYEVVNTFKHDSEAFTQGLLFHEGVLYESTGLTGQSDLRKVDIATGRVLQKVSLPRKSFGEGLALFNNKLYQLTYKEGVCRVFDVSSFELLKEFTYSGEGWGLTNDDKNLIMSDGTHVIRFVNPDTFQTERTIVVFDEENKPLMSINELEMVKGELWANIWHSENIGKPNHIARINPNTGKLLGWIDLNNISPEDIERNIENTLNGIAYDSNTERLFVTGKKWKRLFEIKVKSQ
jgi:glutamine cyclotransferase